MKTKPIIIIPDTKASKDAGLIKSPYGIWHVCYTEDGKRKRLSTGETAKRRARDYRDGVYGELLAAGATVATKGPRPADTWAKRRQRVKKDPEKYLRHDEGVAKPWTVWLDRKQVAGPFETRRQAVIARNRMLLLESTEAVWNLKPAKDA